MTPYYSDDLIKCVRTAEDRWLCATHDGGYFTGPYGGGIRCTMAPSTSGDPLVELREAAQRVIDYAKAHEPANRQDFERLEAALAGVSGPGIALVDEGGLRRLAGIKR